MQQISLSASDIEDILPLGEELSELAKEKQCSSNLPTVQEDVLALVLEKLAFIDAGLHQEGYDFGNALSDVHQMLSKNPGVSMLLTDTQIAIYVKGLAQEKNIVLEPPKPVKPPKLPKPPKEPKPKAPRKKKGATEEPTTGVENEPTA